MKEKKWRVLQTFSLCVTKFPNIITILYNVTTIINTVDVSQSVIPPDGNSTVLACHDDVFFTG